MLRELQRDPDRGLLGAGVGLLHGGPAVVQYWRSFEHLERFARDPASLHLPAWRWFNRAVKASGDVGIWHETYLVRAGGVRGHLRQPAAHGAGRRRPRSHR